MQNSHWGSGSTRLPIHYTCGNYLRFCTGAYNGNRSSGLDNPASNFTVSSTDTITPYAISTSPKDGYVITAGNININGIATEVDSSVNRVRVRVQQLGVSPQLYWNGSNWVTTSNYVEAIVYNEGDSWTLPDVDLSARGNYRIRLIAHDTADNNSTELDNPTIDFSAH